MSTISHLSHQVFKPMLSNMRFCQHAPRQSSVTKIARDHFSQTFSSHALFSSQMKVRFSHIASNLKLLPIKSNQLATQEVTPATQTQLITSTIQRKGAVLSLTLPDSLKESLTERLNAIKLSPYENYHELLDPLGDILRETLPVDLQELLIDKVIKSSPDILLIKNCPVNDNPGPTPLHDHFVPAKGVLEEKWILSLMSLRLSELYRERYEKDGAAFSQIVAIPGKEDVQSSQGSRIAFNEHVEQIHSRPGIDYLYLHCVKGDPNAATEVTPIESLLKGLPAWVIDGMQKPIFAMNPGRIWTGEKTPLIAPILEPNFQGGFFVRFNSDLETKVVEVNGKPTIIPPRIIGINSEGMRVINYLKQHLKIPLMKEQVVLEKGDCLIIPNKQALHGRSGYLPSQPPEKRRHLVRGYAANIWPKIMKYALASQANSFFS